MKKAHGEECYVENLVCELTEEEADVMRRLRNSFLHCEKLQRHVQLLLNHGSLYKIYNNNLLFHGCVPMNENGSFTEVTLFGETHKGKKLFRIARRWKGLLCPLLWPA